MKMTKGDPKDIKWEDVEQTRAYTLEMCSTHCEKNAQAEEKVRYPQIYLFSSRQKNAFV